MTERPAPPPPRADPLAGLGISPRAAEVLALLGRGRTNRQIARSPDRQIARSPDRQIASELYISEKTASVHVTPLLRKLNVASRIEAAAVAQRLGLEE